MGFEEIFENFDLNPATAKAGDAKEAYKNGARKWHPDKWVSGTPKEKEEVEEKFKELSANYDLFNSLFEESLERPEDKSRKNALIKALSETPDHVRQALFNNPEVKQKGLIRSYLNANAGPAAHATPTAKPKPFDVENVQTWGKVKLSKEQMDGLTKFLYRQPLENLAVLSEDSRVSYAKQMYIDKIYSQKEKLEEQTKEISILLKSDRISSVSFGEMKEAIEKIETFRRGNRVTQLAYLIVEVEAKIVPALFKMSAKDLNRLSKLEGLPGNIVDEIKKIAASKEKFCDIFSSQEELKLLETENWSGLNDDDKIMLNMLLRKDPKKTLMLYKEPSFSAKNKEYIAGQLDTIIKGFGSKLDGARFLMEFGQYEKAAVLLSQVAKKNLKEVSTLAVKGKNGSSDHDKSEIAQYRETNKTIKQMLDEIMIIAKNSAKLNPELQKAVTIAKLDIYIEERKNEPDPWYNKFFAYGKDAKITAATDYRDYLKTGKGYKELENHKGALENGRLADIVKGQGGFPSAQSHTVMMVKSLGVDASKSPPASETRDEIKQTAGASSPSSVRHQETAAQKLPSKSEPVPETRIAAPSSKSSPSPLSTRPS